MVCHRRNMKSLASSVILVISLSIPVIECLVVPVESNEIPVEKDVKLAPKLSESGKVILYTLDVGGTFHRYSLPENPQKKEVTYSVLKNGILAPTDGPFALKYDLTEQGDLVPKSSNKCIYKSDKRAFYLQGLEDILIPVEIFHAGNEIQYIFDGRILYSESIDKTDDNQAMSVKIKPDILVPEKSCCGDIVLFLLKSNGVFARNPPDEYLPNGMKLKYRLQDDGTLSPQLSQKSDGLELSYETAENGNLKPSDNNTHTLTTTKESTKSFILGEGGVIAPVSEVMGSNKTVSYFFDGRLIHSSNQFKQIFSNSSIVYLTERNKNTTETTVTQNRSTKRIFKRDVEPNYEEESNTPYDEESDKKCPGCTFEPKGAVKPASPYVYDDYGKRIQLDPFRCENGNVALFKLTCTGQLKRLDHHKEPECNFSVYFKLLDSCILVPLTKPHGKIVLKYILQPNGSLTPARDQKCSLKKAPASVCYFILGKNLELIPCRLSIEKGNHVHIFYQDSLIYTMSPSQAKEMELFTTLYAPLCAIFNGHTTIIWSDPASKPSSGSTWLNPGKTEENLDYQCKSLYLVGPNNTKIKIVPDTDKKNNVIIYEMDADGICHKSPKDNNRNLGLRSFMLLRDGILLQSNTTSRYIYLIDKHGNMMPCCYPETKLRAPFGLTVKYLCCKNGVYLPILIEAFQNHIRFSYENNVVYWRRAYSISEIVERWGCEIQEEDELEDDKFQKENNCFVYFERKGDCFVRHPSKEIPEKMTKYPVYLYVREDGVLVPTTSDSELQKKNGVEARVSRDGNFCIIASTGRKPERTHYLLNKEKEMVPVDCIVKDGVYKFYQNKQKIGEQHADAWLEAVPETIENEDPMDLFNDEKPSKAEKSNMAETALYIPPKSEESKSKNSIFNDKDLNFKKCAQIRECMMDMVKKSPSCTNMDITANQAMSQDIARMLSICSKVKKNKERTQRHVNSPDFAAPEKCASDLQTL